MPGFDGTGPMGMGPMTGGARGYCNSDSRGFLGRGFRPRPVSGRGRGRGFRNMYWATGLPGWARSGPGGFRDFPYYGPYGNEQEIDFLKDQAAVLKEEMDFIDSRLKELESKE